MNRRKNLQFTVVVSVPHWMTDSEAKREIRTLINEQTNYMSLGPKDEEVTPRTVRARSVS